MASIDGCYHIAGLIDAHNPCIHPSAAINANLRIDLRQRRVNGELQPMQFQITGNHDRFPWHELYLNGVQVFACDPCIEQTTFANLFPGTEKSYPGEFSVWRQVPGAKQNAAVANPAFAAAAAENTRLRGDFGPPIDDSWTISANGQSVQVNQDGSYTVLNVSAADQFGVAGPGTPPDFLSDDYTRLTATRTLRGSNEYAISEPFRLRKRPRERRLTSAAQVVVRECGGESPVSSDFYAAARRLGRV